ncbi:hypothetical protein QR680_006006 [Steinernema hermaphroditum]|nr:hypothetical protein QR680_006006 [Steinernema hermaphroditum]
MSQLKTKRYYGFRVLIGSCIVSAVTIGLVLWDERLQRERRQEGVRYRMKSIQQQHNMTEYELQKQRYEEYKAQHS